MKKINKDVCFLILIFIASLFMSIGYAALYSSGEIDVVAEVSAPNSIYIYDASKDDSLGQSTINAYYQTMFSSTTVLSKTDSNSSVTYVITLYNNTDKDQEFVGVNYDPAFYDNENITYELSGLNIGDKVDKKSGATFTITFHYLNSVLSENNVLNSYLNFQFKERHKVEYVNVTQSAISSNKYPTFIVDGGTFDLNLNRNVQITKVTMADKTLISDVDYTFVNNVLSVPNVTGNLVITVEAISTPILNDNGQYYTGSEIPGYGGHVLEDGWVGDIYTLSFSIRRGVGIVSDYTYTVKITNNTDYVWENIQNIDEIVDPGNGIFGYNSLQGFTSESSHQYLNPGETLTISFNVRFRTSLDCTASGKTIVKFMVNGEEKQLELNINFIQR